jgi:hypothetical protein
VTDSMLVAWCDASAWGSCNACGAGPRPSEGRRLATRVLSVQIGTMQLRLCGDCARSLKGKLQIATKGGRR